MPRWSWLPRTRRRTPAAPEDETLVFAGSASPRLAAAICRHLGVEAGRGEVLRFSEGTLFVRVLQNVRGRRVYLVQSTVFPANDHLVELLFWIDALKRASAESVTAVIPYFAYGKGDKKDEPRVSIRARVCADAIEGAGANRVVTMDLHAPQIQGFFRAPVDDLYAVDRLCAALRSGLQRRQDLAQQRVGGRLNRPGRDDCAFGESQRGLDCSGPFSSRRKRDRCLPARRCCHDATGNGLHLDIGRCPSDDDRS